MKRFAILVAVIACVPGTQVLAEPANPAEQQLANAIREIQTQQAQIAENQAKIEAKLATIAEAVRVARIYSSRAGH
jgi:hemolysin activation/secretion protein